MDAGTATPPRLDRPLPAAWARLLDAVGSPALLHAGAQVLLANAAMERLLGFPREQLQAMRFDAWAAEGSKEALQRHSARALQRDEEQPVLELEAQCASGAIRVLELVQRRLPDARGHPLLLLTATDLSDMRYVQQSLTDMGRLMQQIVDNDPLPTFVLNAEHRVTHWNAACAQLTGVPAYEAIGRHDAWRAFHDDAQLLLADLVLDERAESDGPACFGDSLRRGVRGWECEVFLPRLGQHGAWVQFSAAALHDADGRISGVIGKLQDVSARHAADEALRRHGQALEEMVAARTAELLITHHDLDAFLENAPVGILATEGRRVVRSNRTFGTLFGLPVNGATELDLRRLFTSLDDYRLLQGLASEALGAGRAFAHEMRMQSLSGEPLWVQLIAYPGGETAGRPRIWWLLQDRSAVLRAQQELVANFRHLQESNARLAEAQSQLLQSEKMASIGQLAAGVAHEINNPIGYVTSNLGTLGRYLDALLALLAAHERCAGAEELEALRRETDLAYLIEDLPALLHESEEGLSRVRKIVQDLKDFSRVDSADWQEADLNAGLESTLNVVMNEVKYKAEIQRDYGRLPPVRCLAGQLNQVFLNLIVNAAQAIEGQGHIRLSTGTGRLEGRDAVWIEVADDGCGMDEATQRRIFEPFFTTKPVGKGTGLGLSLSFSIVKKHGGRIELESQPGEGTRFRVWVPVDGPAP